MNEQQSALLEAQIAKIESVLTAPTILQPLLEMLRLPSDEIRIEKIVEMVSLDGAIAASCLRMSNSPLFGHRPVETVRAAVMALGISRVRSLLFGVCMHQTIPTDKWVLDPNSFWRHSLGCALVAQTMANGIGYPEPEKAYLAGLIHDIGFLVNSVLYTAKFRECLQHAVAQRCPLHVSEALILGFTHEDSGRMLSKRWGLSEELFEVVGCHHQLEFLPSAGPIVCLVHLGDLLCRVRNLGYGYDEVLAVTLAQDSAWKHLVNAYPALAEVDLVRFTLDIDGAMDHIAALVDSVFAAPRSAAAPIA
ncbi:MAG: HDOD domain-containing protein [Terriglobales bacterium]